MALPTELQQQLIQLLGTVDDDRLSGPRLADDARRLWQRVQKLAAANTLRSKTPWDLDGLELASFALQLPARQQKDAAAYPGRLGHCSLRDRCEQAAEMLVSLLGDQLEGSLLDRAARILRQTPAKAPASEEARLLADAVNLEDFGIGGLLRQQILIALRGGGIADLTDAAVKREQYHYWDARLKDGFHFDTARELAQARLKSVRSVMEKLKQELTDDQPQ